MAEMAQCGSLPCVSCGAIAVCMRGLMMMMVSMYECFFLFFASVQIDARWHCFFSNHGYNFLPRKIVTGFVVHSSYVLGDQGLRPTEASTALHGGGVMVVVQAYK